MDHYEEGVKALTGLAEIKKGAVEILAWLHRHGPLSFDEIVALKVAAVKRFHEGEQLMAGVHMWDECTTRPVLFDLSNLMSNTHLIEHEYEEDARGVFRFTPSGRTVFPAYLRMARKIPPRPLHQGWGDVEGDPESEAAALRRFRREARS